MDRGGQLARARRGDFAAAALVADRIRDSLSH